jgi:hypothetical protein
VERLKEERLKEERVRKERLRKWKHRNDVDISEESYSNRFVLGYMHRPEVPSSVSFPGFPVPDFPGSRRFFHSRFPGKLVRDSRKRVRDSRE